MIKKYLLKKGGKYAAIYLILLGLFIISLYSIARVGWFLTVGPPLIIAPIVFLLGKEWKNHGTLEVRNINTKVYDILFYLLISISLLTLHSWGSRGVIFFLVLSICAGVIAISVPYCVGDLCIIHKIVQITVLSCTIKYSIFSYVGGIPGVDSSVHAQMNSILAHTGTIGQLFDKEISFPIMHIQVAIVKILTDSGIKDANSYAMVIPFVIISLFVFLICAQMFDNRVGLLALLTYSVADWNTFWGSSPATTTYGIMIYSILVYAVIQLLIEKKRKIWIILYISLILSLFLAHAVSSFIFIVSLVGLIIGYCLFNYLKNDWKVISRPLWLLLLAIVILIQHWAVAIYSANRSASFFDTIIYYLDDAIERGQAAFLNRAERSSEFVSQYTASMGDQIFDKLGFTLLLLLAAVGFLIWLLPRYQDQRKFSIITCCVILLTLTFGFPLFGMRNIMPMRWFGFIYIFLSIGAALAITSIYLVPKRNGIRATFIITIFILLSFFMLGSNISNAETPIWSKEYTRATTYSISEEISSYTLSDISSNLIVDNIYRRAFIFNNRDDRCEYFSSYEQINHLNGQNQLFIWREYMLERPIFFGFHEIEGMETVQKYGGVLAKNEILGSEVYDELNNEQCKVFNSGTLKGFL